MELVFFLGRFHVLLLHLPIGIVVAVVVLEALSRTERFRHLAPAAPYLWGLAALSAVGTAALGYMHFAEGGFDGPAAFRHRLFGTTVAVVTTAVWALRTGLPLLSWRVRMFSGALVLVLVTITGHYGGELTHGDTYLVEHAPGFVRSLAGLQPVRQRVTSLAMANPYLDIVQPIFDARCTSCHNENKRRGGLSLVSFESLGRGGKDGVVIVAGDPQGSDLIRRIGLPEDHKDKMPAEGKTALTPEQVEILRWWVASGAHADTTLAGAKLDFRMQGLMVAALGLGKLDAHGFAMAQPARAEQTADAKTVDALVQAGFQVRQVSRSDARLVVSGVGIRQLSAAQLETLSAARIDVADLSLRQLNLSDADLGKLASFTELMRLNVADNLISDAGVARLASLKKLESLNLHGNAQVGDASLQLLVQLPALTKLYLWNTAVDVARARALANTHPNITIDVGSDAVAQGAATTATAPRRDDGT